MILTENRNFLAKTYPQILNMLKQEEENIKQHPIKVVESQCGLPTLVVNEGKSPYYIHSRYNPIQEAEILIKKYNEVDRYKHVFFYGLGLGYHVELFLKQYPHLEYTVYEPDLATFCQFISTRSLLEFPVERLRKLYVDSFHHGYSIWIHDFVAKIKDEVLIVVLPSYERKDPNRFSQFCDAMKEAVKEEKHSLRVNISFEKRWVINSLMNLPTTLKTPSIFSRREFFERKPAIIVSAGPSLEDEIERLRLIKEQGLAYIFAVGSANKALIKHKIIPDAVSTYDPLPWNHIVMSDIKYYRLKIPMIFGTTVGYETLEDYPGPMFNMLINQDSITPLLIKANNTEQLNIISDAPSIAIVTLELLFKMMCDPIILVGQNFAFRNKQYYAKGVYHGYRDEKPNENELRNTFKVKDVIGQWVLTNDSFNSMKISMERLIHNYRMGNVINTTQGGAHIEGTRFAPLEEVMQELVSGKVVSEEAFSQEEMEVNHELIQTRKRQLEREFEELTKIINKFEKLLNEVKDHLQQKKKKLLEDDFEKLNGPLKKMEGNLLYNHLIRPLNRVQQELLFREMEGIRKETNPLTKAEKILLHFGKYIMNCKRDMLSTFQLLQEKIRL